MTKVSLAEAVKLKSILSKRIHELEEEMYRVAFVQIEVGHELPKQPRSLLDVENDLEVVRKDLRLLDKLMYQANIENEIIFNEEALSIVEAIEYATQLRAKAKKCKEFGTYQKIEHLYSYGENISLTKVAMFDPESYRLKGLECERLANKLSNLINAKNYSIQVDFDSANYF
ncbi:hypothetical protein ACOI1C_15975 [Bacillus sp. DJP31]|uniref:hypothetical protein n=1 Tax=Bacillus sp. DJP31 TaxID=3409789 RepID=UPI003BB60017